MRKEHASQAEAATRVQTVLRGNAARKELVRMEEATVRVQAVQRGKVARRPPVPSVTTEATPPRASEAASPRSPQSSGMEGWLKKIPLLKFILMRSRVKPSYLVWVNCI